MSYEDDYKIAFKLQKKFEQEDKRKRTAKVSKEFEKQIKPQEISNSVSIIDKSLEYIDPNPDIHALFIHFNDVYFWKKLLSVEVRWSPRMTSCAGVCCYEGRGRLCSIRLSLPLLKLRPRKDLVETLLHEMIHAYLFVTNNNRDRDGHGPEFHKHMNRINKSAGTKITVYHSFHDEVRSYQQHWWKCDGPCRNRPPYFGMVRRAMNRAPGPSDFWWSDHQASCGGKYVKIREPEGYSAGKKQSKGGAGSITKGKGKLTAIKSLSNTPKAKPNISKIKSHMPKPSSPKSKPSVASGNDPISKPGILNFFTPTKPQQISGLSEPGNGLSKVAGAVKGPLQKESSSSLEKTITNSFMPFSGEGHVLGGKRGSIVGSKKEAAAAAAAAAAARAPPVKQPRMSKAFPTNWGVTSISSSPSPVSRVNGSISESKEGRPTVECPACGKQQTADKINEHLDECLASSGKEGESNHTLPETTSSGERWLLECPGCRIKVEEENFDDHLNQCEKLLNGKSEMGGSGEGTSELDDDDSDVVVLENEKCVCPACGVSMASFLIGEHLETCLSSLCFEEDDE